MFLEYWFVLWEEMFRPTDVFAGYRGERSSWFVYCISLIFFYVEYIIYGDTRFWRSFPYIPHPVKREIQIDPVPNITWVWFGPLQKS